MSNTPSAAPLGSLLTSRQFDETAARADLDRARSRYAAARANAVRAYDERAAALADLKCCEDEYALMVAFDGRPPRVGDVMREGVAPGYPEGRIVEIRIVKPNGLSLPATSVHVTVETPRGTYVARRLVEPRKAQP